ncbi:type IV pilin N-terminal domain-containing protein [Methanonatronarchaeum sp. AMET-Sl]|uniref:type IV pilin N-terminal domain-containing protein n=1 Tax=Methanonatronarchaeum sp. AMET-Sl TaxID=3037654 RepID=UPI00244DAC35|nr:type IV pilin N-terminal domain-containing protein [Methanonatronarchaeum sp. AMET-Sl]WGI18025.1 type IV pilin N-terminal domain-containing protein [Methanonatronarchaeum sp. AMET-Sl]
MKKFSRKISFSDESGISPVIGVIMMISIVVLLAAIVAAFTFGAINIPTTTPTASISLENIEIQDNEGVVYVTLLHESGQSLVSDKTNILVTNLNTSQTNTTSLEKSINGEQWSPGERITVVIGLGNSQDLLELGDEVEVRVVDLDSGGTVGSLISVLS